MYCWKQSEAIYAFLLTAYSAGRFFTFLKQLGFCDFPIKKSIFCQFQSCSHTLKPLKHFQNCFLGCTGVQDDCRLKFRRAYFLHHQVWLSLANQPTNQPTKELTMSGVLRRRTTSSHDKLNHSCVRNAELDLKRNRRYNKWGYAYTNGFVVLAEGLDMFRLGLLTLAGIRTRQTICTIQKELRLAGCLRVEPRGMGSLWLRAWATLVGNHFGWRPPLLGDAARAPF
jgi:hypothetical protein